MGEHIFLQISAILAVTVSVAFLLRLLKQPLIVSYLIAGIVSGPMFLNVLSGANETYEALASFGVVLLLFVVGLSLNLSHIRKIGTVSIITGLAQVFFTSIVGFGILRALGMTQISAFYLAVGITFSSTIIIVKLLADKKDTETMYGRYTLGLMIVQDIVAILIMLILTSVLGQSGSWQESLSLFALKLLALLMSVYVLSRYVVPSILRKIASSGEFLFIFTVAWCFGIASILHLIGFSLEIGAIVAGISLGSSSFQAEISSRMRPLRDFFIVIFFLILGSQMTLYDARSVIVPSMILSAFILLGNPFILYHTFRFCRFTRRNSFMAGVTAAQVSEFGFVLLYTGMQVGHIAGSEVQIFTIVALITIILSSYAITYSEQLYRALQPIFRLFGPDKYVQSEHHIVPAAAFVFGYHRMGWRICQTLKEKGTRFVVVDYNPETVEKLEHHGLPSVFGDAGDVEFLDTLPFEKTKLVISTLPGLDDQETLIRFVRTKNSKARIIATSYDLLHVAPLYAAGADYVILPHQLGGEFIGDVLLHKPWSHRTFSQMKERQEKEIAHRVQAGTAHNRD